MLVLSLRFADLRLLSCFALSLPNVRFFSFLRAFLGAFLDCLRLFFFFV